VCMHVCMYVCMCVSTFVYVCMYVCMYVRVYVCVCTCVCARSFVFAIVTLFQVCVSLGILEMFTPRFVLLACVCVCVRMCVCVRVMHVCVCAVRACVCVRCVCVRLLLGCDIRCYTMCGSLTHAQRPCAHSSTLEESTPVWNTHTQIHTCTHMCGW
jgi:hypothetical protein